MIMLFFAKLPRMLPKLSATTAALWLSALYPTHAETIVSSLNNTSSFVNFSIGAWAGSSFKTDTQTWTLTSATVTLELGAVTSSTANVRLSDNAGKPGVTVADLGTVSVTNASQLYIFTAPTTVTLDPSTAYWIVVGNVGTNGGLNVRLSQPGESFTNSGVTGASMTNSISSGATTSEGPPTAWTASTPGISLLFAVDGTRLNVSGPRLTIDFANPQRVYLTWPTNFTGYSLQSTTNLPTTVWTTVTNIPTISSNRFAQSLNRTAARQFFRLTKPYPSTQAKILLNTNPAPRVLLPDVERRLRDPVSVVRALVR